MQKNSSVSKTNAENAVGLRLKSKTLSLSSNTWRPIYALYQITNNSLHYSTLLNAIRYQTWMPLIGNDEFLHQKYIPFPWILQ